MVRLFLLSVITAMTFVPAVAASRVENELHGRRLHRHHARRSAAPRYGEAYGAGHGRPYAGSISPTPTCRYPDGTPFDPDIIGGPNHVGDGGPAANLGGFDPCEP